MTQNNNWYLLRFSLVLGFFFAVGVLGHALPQTRGLMLAATPWFLLLSGAAALAVAWPRQGAGRFVLWLVLAYGITLAVEIYGVASARVFGAYHYGPTLGLAVGGVPLIIGFNWVLVILACVSLFDGLPGSRWWGPLPAAILATAFDWIMEPLAVRLDYWQWDGGTIPLQNYLAWFAIALVLGASRNLLATPLGRDSLAVLVALEAIFFFVLHLVV